MVLPLKTNLFGKTFAQYYILQNEIWISTLIFSATIRSIRSEGVKILKSQKYPLVNSLSLFFNRKKKQIN